MRAPAPTRDLDKESEQIAFTVDSSLLLLDRPVCIPCVPGEVTQVTLMSELETVK